MRVGFAGSFFAKEIKFLKIHAATACTVLPIHTVCFIVRKKK